jgi:hypothetical protein
MARTSPRQIDGEDQVRGHLSNLEVTYPRVTAGKG